MNLSASTWREVLENSSIESYYDLFVLFDRLSKKKQGTGSEEDYLAFKLIAELCSMHLKAESLADPFGPMFSGPGGRTMIPKDLTDSELDALSDFLSEVDNPWLQARVADVLWVRRKGPQYWRAALDAYRILVDSAIRTSHEARELTSRALALARVFDLDTWRLMIEELVDRFLNEEIGGAMDGLDLFGLFSGFLKSIERREEVITHLIGLGDRAFEDQSFFIARDCWVAAREQLRVLRRLEDEYRLTHRIADSLLAEARHRGVPDGNEMVSGHFIREALAEYTELPRSYRKEQGIESQIVELRKELGMVGREVVQSMESFSTEPLDITEMVRMTESRISGLSLPDALAEYCKMCYRTSVESSREMAKRLIRDFPMSHILGGKSYSSDGLIVAHRPPMNVNNADSFEQIVEIETVRQHGVALGISVAGTIHPGLEVLQREHYISLEFCRRMAAQSVVVPLDRVESWAKGVYYGLHGSFFEAAHILIPQIEHWLRWLLQAEGFDTIVREKDGTDVQWSLETSLRNDAVRNMLNEGLWYELNYFFLSEHGANLRNELLHGLLPDSELNESLLASFWHMCLRILVLNIPWR